MPFDAEGFAKLVARFDTGNSNEAEAVSAARALRRMVVSDGLRIVDVMGRADVMAALDAQLQPVREDSQELKAAFVEIARLADLVRQRDEAAAERTPEIGKSSIFAPCPQPAGAGLVNGGLVAAVVISALVLMIATIFH